MYRIAVGASGAGGSVISGAEARPSFWSRFHRTAPACRRTAAVEIFAGAGRDCGATVLNSRPVRASVRTIIVTRVELPAVAAKAMALPAVITGNSIEQIRIILF